MSYWNVGVEEELEGPPDCSGAEQDGADEMGAKQSAAEGVAPTRSPTLENIRATYKEGEDHAARQLIRLALQGCGVDQPGRLGLLCAASEYGDMESVHFLLQDAHVQFPQEPSEENPAILAAHYGHHTVVQELLSSVPRQCIRKDLLNWMLATACQRGHFEVVKLLVLGYQADADECGGHSDDFAVITGLPLYAAARAGNKEIATFLLDNGAGFSSYTLMDHAEFSLELLRQRLLEDKDTHCDRKVEQPLSVHWSGLKLQWLELDWFLEVSARITVLDLSHNNLTSLPSVVPWGLIHLHTLNLSYNQLKELPTPHSSQEIICSRLCQVDLSENELESLPTGLLHLGHVQSISAAKNKLVTLFDIPNGTNWIGLRRLRDLDVSCNCLSDLPFAVLHCFKSLNNLNISSNRLSHFPDPWACPLKTCKAANNQIKNLPDTISIFWKTQLKEVDFSENALKELPSYIFELEVIRRNTTGI